ncbi:MAG TPA: ROK family transcriptional regulator [Spirochaetales bacterium]|nr:ROK family transcriptional regulator [Spirochaetales bacterium]HRY53870.1 ROK family transcriptional regulator [Spirochaetia bacterium]HRZ64722.1 ROK family transcriptional regulator [Spirochaetia bacterium]
MPRGAGPVTQTAARIVRTIWQNPRISRVDIAEHLGLDKSTVTNQVSRLIALGIIKETSEGEAGVKGGRRPIHLAIDPSYGLVLGIEIQAESYVALAVDLVGGIVGQRRGKLSFSPASFAESALDLIRSSSAELCPQGSRLLGIGVGAGGLIDAKRGLINYSVPLGIDRPVDFGKAVASRLALPCLVENDANCCAWGELAWNKDEALRDFLFALVEFRKDGRSLGRFGGLGVGFGVALGGKVFAGAHGHAGEFRSAFCEGPGELQFALPRETLGRIDEDGEALEAASDELARNMAMLVNTMDFDRVYVGGDIESLGLDFPSLLRRRLAENWMYSTPKEVDIRFSSLGGRAVAYGAAGMVLDRLLSGRMLPELGGRAARGQD